MARTAATGRVAMRGYGDKSLQFDGANDYVDFGTTNFNFERTDSFSVSMWINPAGGTSNHVIFGRAAGTVDFRGWWIRYEVSTSSYNVFLSNDFVGANYLWKRAVGKAQKRIGTRFGFSYDGTSAAAGLILYIDGAAVSTTIMSNTLSATMVTAGVNARMGTITDDTLDYNGNVTDVAVYNRVLTAQEMSDIHFSGIYPTDNLYARYLFDEGSGATLTDTSGNGRNGPITAATWSTAIAPLALSRTVAPSTQNLLLRSEEFDNASWARSNLTVTANSVANPIDGAVTADTINISTDGGSVAHNTDQAVGGTILAGRTYCFSIYLKANGAQWVRMDSASTKFPSVWYDILNGVLGATQGTGVISKSITSVGNGWYRCEFVYTAEVGAQRCRLWINNADGVNNFQADGTQNLYAWGAQCVQANYSGPYVQTVASIVDTGAIRSIASTTRTVAS